MLHGRQFHRLQTLLLYHIFEVPFFSLHHGFQFLFLLLHVHFFVARSLVVEYLFVDSDLLIERLQFLVEVAVLLIPFGFVDGMAHVVRQAPVCFIFVLFQLLVLNRTLRRLINADLVLHRIV